MNEKPTPATQSLTIRRWATPTRCLFVKCWNRTNYNYSAIYPHANKSSKIPNDITTDVENKRFYLQLQWLSPILFANFRAQGQRKETHLCTSNEFLIKKVK